MKRGVNEVERKKGAKESFRFRRGSIPLEWEERSSAAAADAVVSPHFQSGSLPMPTSHASSSRNLHSLRALVHVRWLT